MSRGHVWGYGFTNGKYASREPNRRNNSQPRPRARRECKKDVFLRFRSIIDSEIKRDYNIRRVETWSERESITHAQWPSHTANAKSCSCGCTALLLPAPLSSAVSDAVPAAPIPQPRHASRPSTPPPPPLSLFPPPVQGSAQVHTPPEARGRSRPKADSPPSSVHPACLALPAPACPPPAQTESVLSAPRTATRTDCRLPSH